MTNASIVAQLPFWPDGQQPTQSPVKQGFQHTYWQNTTNLPPWVADTPGLLRTLDLLGPLDWANFPERDLTRDWGQTAIPYSALVTAFLIKLNEGLDSCRRLHIFLAEHPGFIWLLGFPRVPDLQNPRSFNTRASLPDPRHFTAMLRHMPNSALQFLLTDTIRLIRIELARLQVPSIDCISLDTKHLYAWVKENNSKAYISERYNPAKQPAGDPDCRLGCKRKRNINVPATPTRKAQPAQTLKVGQWVWGYGSGLIVTKVPDRGEFVLAELTQSFDHGDATYFAPLIAQTEARLGYCPRNLTADAAFDAWYIYAHFYRPEDPSAFAAVPAVNKGGHGPRQFSPEGLPLCEAELPMRLLFTFTDRTTCLVEHERGKYGCPILHDSKSRKRVCPIHHARWPHGGCTALMPTSMGARIRHELDRKSATYQAAYNQRTAVERINSQAVALGIERPHFRNGPAIANYNTLIYILINLRFLHRLRQA